MAVAVQESSAAVLADAAEAVVQVPVVILSASAAVPVSVVPEASA